MNNQICKFALLALLPIVVLACSGEKSANESTIDRLSQKELQYYTNGRQLYTKYCQNCHMEEGEGLGRLIPPLAKSDYLISDLGRAAQIIKYGQKGPIVVNGIAFNQPMPANPKMTNSEIQMILAFVTNAWGNQSDILSIEEIERAIAEE